MGRLAERQIIEAIESLSTRDDRRACRLVAADAMIDAMQHVIEERAVATIARRQPVAYDLWQLIGIPAAHRGQGRAEGILGEVASLGEAPAITGPLTETAQARGRRLAAESPK